MRALIDSRLRHAIPDHWDSRCTIQMVTYTTTAANQRVPSGATDVAGMVNVPCRLAAIIFSRPTDNEIRDQKIQEKLSHRHLKLNGWFPSITPRRMQAVVDGVVYPIVGVEGDSQQFSTRLRLEVVKP